MSPVVPSLAQTLQGGSRNGLTGAPNKPDRFIIWWMIVIHAIALITAPLFFSWSALAVACVLFFLTGCLGITFGYHRLLSHRSFKAPRWIERVAATIGVLSLQGGPIEWVAHHRMHHAKTDTEDDPHNARRGFWFSHIGWLFIEVERFDDPAIMRKYARDIAADPYMTWLQTSRAQVLLQVILGLILLAVGGLSWMFYGVFIRIVAGYHGTWFVNSACHMFGYRNYETTDLSTNCWWVGLLAWGEGWHNNHHADPSAAPAGRHWWEVDVTMGVIRVLEKLGLAWDIKMPVENPLAEPIAVPLRTVARNAMRQATGEGSVQLNGQGKESPAPSISPLAYSRE